MNKRTVVMVVVMVTLAAVTLGLWLYWPKVPYVVLEPDGYSPNGEVIGRAQQFYMCARDWTESRDRTQPIQGWVKTNGEVEICFVQFDEQEQVEIAYRADRPMPIVGVDNGGMPRLVTRTFFGRTIGWIEVSRCKPEFQCVFAGVEGKDGIYGSWKYDKRGAQAAVSAAVIGEISHESRYDEEGIHVTYDMEMSGVLQAEPLKLWTPQGWRCPYSEAESAGRAVEIPFDSPVSDWNAEVKRWNAAVETDAEAKGETVDPKELGSEVKEVPIQIEDSCIYWVTANGKAYSFVRPYQIRRGNGQAKLEVIRDRLILTTDRNGQVPMYRRRCCDDDAHLISSVIKRVVGAKVKWQELCDIFGHDTFLIKPTM